MARTRRILMALALGLTAGVGMEGAGAPGARANADGPEARAEAASLRLVVNIAARRLDVYEGGERLRSYPVAVGKPGHRTPRGEYAISRVIWNPWWHPPNSGWARGKGPVPPGPGNPMGRVKMYFRKFYYIHGTSDEGSLGRAASHGCVRMANEDAIELARLVHRHGTPGLPESELDRLEANPRRTKTIWLERPVPVEIRYDVAELRDGRLELHPDVYGLAGGTVRERVAQLLVRHGYPAHRVDDDRLESLIRQSRSEPVSVPVESLIETAAAVPAAAVDR